MIVDGRVEVDGTVTELVPGRPQVAVVRVPDDSLAYWRYRRAACTRLCPIVARASAT